jgi:hypothetical protein
MAALLGTALRCWVLRFKQAEPQETTGLIGKSKSDEQPTSAEWVSQNLRKLKDWFQLLMLGEDGLRVQAGVQQHIVDPDTCSPHQYNSHDAPLTESSIADLSFTIDVIYYIYKPHGDTKLEAMPHASRLHEPKYVTTLSMMPAQLNSHLRPWRQAHQGAKM